MPKDRTRKAPPASTKKSQRVKTGPSSASTKTAVQPISRFGLVAAIGSALVIAAILLFVINTRLNAAKPAPATPTAPRAAVATPTTASVSGPSAPSGASAGITQVGGFAKGNPQAKVTVIEFADFR